MNIELRGNVFVAGKKENLSFDGKTTFYSLAIVTPDGDAGNISCNESVYNAVVPMRQYTLTCVYRDGQYKGLRCVAAAEEVDRFAGIDSGVAFSGKEAAEK